MMVKELNKPIIETMINTTALALTSFGTVQITIQGFHWHGYVAIIFGMLLEFGKYTGRKFKLW